MFKIIVLLFSALAINAYAAHLERESCAGCSEQELNREIFSLPMVEIPRLTQKEIDQLHWPDFQTSWGLTENIYREAQARYTALKPRLSNLRYAVVIDFNKRSSQKRFYLFDLLEGQVEAHHTAHGAGSDDGGYATQFSNEDGTHMSSLGAYITMNTYFGHKGYSLRLSGLDPTNDAAEARAIVVHPADYVDEGSNHAGLSWGCPALDPSVSQSIIDRIQSGSLLYIGRD